jgi:hypothetical protein
MATANPRQELETKVAERATQDATFRQRLIDNPVETLRNELNIPVPDGVKITVLEENTDNYYLVLPQPTVNEEKLTAEQLDAVAGGGCIYAWWTLACTNF